jgi:hypothetical protein
MLAPKLSLQRQQSFGKRPFDAPTFENTFTFPTHGSQGPLSSMKDSSGKLLQRGAKCLRFSWHQQNRFENKLNLYLCWEVAQWGDGSLFLSSRPAGVSLEVTEDNAQHLRLYEEPPELNPTDYPAQWELVQKAHLDVWATIEGQLLTLHAIPVAKITHDDPISIPANDHISVTGKRAKMDIPDKELGAYMWEELLEKIKLNVSCLENLERKFYFDSKGSSDLPF